MAPHSQVNPRAEPPRVFNVPAGQPFLDRLAAAILAGDLPRAGGSAPALIDLPAITLLLPTRRATRALQEAFLRAGGGRAMLLPRIKPISEGEEELSLLAGAANIGSLGVDDIPPAVSAIERRLALTKLIMAWSRAMRSSNDAADFLSDRAPMAGSDTPAQAAALAAELGRLMDMVETEGKTFDDLAGLVPDALSAHWQQTLAFLEIVTTHWPLYLEERALISPVARRNRLILAEAERLRAMPPEGPVIVAGVTGSIPATVELMRVVAALPNGAIVLPALDTHLDEESWAAIAPGGGDPETVHTEHPGFGLQKLLSSLSVARRDVVVLPGAELDTRMAERARLVSEAMRPSATTARWQTFAASVRNSGVGLELATRGLSAINVPTAQDEAEVIALIMRRAIETPGRTAALVSPDRLLARRVAVRLEAWGLKIDDSAGRPFAKTVPGAFLDLTIEAVARRFAPAALMSLLKHPLTRLGLDPFAARRAARALEIAAFRTAYLGDGIDGVEAAIDRAEHDVGQRTRRDRAVQRLRADDFAAARDLVTRLRHACAPLLAFYGHAGQQTLRAFANAHANVAEALATVPAEADSGAASSPLWQGEAGQAALAFFTGLMDSAMQPVDVDIAAADYADIYRSLIAGENVLTRRPVHPRLSIWGPFEARLQQPDIVILGSLNEGTWPEAADPGPWLNRPMRATLGLPSPEEKIGNAAHDFTSLLGAPEVIMTRAEKVDGVPTVASRWLLRFRALLEGCGAHDALAPTEPWIAWARHRDHAVRLPPLARPEPRPPVAIRPRKLSATRIEAWLANPYAIFARDILRLEPLEQLGAEPGPALRGSIIHAALSRFSQSFPGDLPSDARDRLIRTARDILDEYASHPRIAAFWVPRFERFADWFVATEPARRAGVDTIFAETSGAMVLEGPAGPFTLTARADRIDVRADGTVITDYKTGKPPGPGEVRSFRSPQLPLEAAIAIAQGFADVPPLPVLGLRYIRASGAEPPGEQSDVANGKAAELAAGAVQGLRDQIARFDREETPYAALRRPQFDYRYDDYAHLARVAEWMAVQANGEDEP